jgi:hypothetical protein
MNTYKCSIASRTIDNYTVPYIEIENETYGYTFKYVKYEQVVKIIAID